MKKTAFITTALGTMFAFSIALAQGTGSGLATSNLSDLITQLTGILNQLVFLVAALAIVVFIWSLVRYLASADDAEARKEWRGYMIYGVVAFAVITGLWGLVNAVLDLVGLGGSPIPQFPVGNSNIDQSPNIPNNPGQENNA